MEGGLSVFFVMSTSASSTAASLGPVTVFGLWSGAVGGAFVWRNNGGGYSATDRWWVFGSLAVPFLPLTEPGTGRFHLR